MSDRYRQHHPAAEVISEAERIIRDAEAGMTKPPEPDWFFLLFLVPSFLLAVPFMVLPVALDLWLDRSSS